MKGAFWKVAATGNDFIVIDDREGGGFSADPKRVSQLCARRTGIGADGLLVLKSPLKSHQASGGRGCDFCMVYFNADGSEAEMCGNGARAISYFYHQITDQKQQCYRFKTQNSHYTSRVQGNFVQVHMTEISHAGAIAVDDLLAAKFSYYINTGVPHCVYEVEHLAQYDVTVVAGRIIKNPRFERGVNCNFFEQVGQKIELRTFERGVGAETLACGTGAVAVALALYLRGDRRKCYAIATPGGELSVEVESLERVYLGGTVEHVFSGEFNL